MNKSMFLAFETRRIWKLKAEVLGTSFRTSINGIDVIVHMPVFKPSELFFIEICEPDIMTSIALKSDKAYGQNPIWGTPLAFHVEPRQPIECEIYKLLIEIPNPDQINEEANNWAHKNLNAWSAQITERIEFLGYQVTDPQSRELQSPVSDNIELWIPNETGQYRAERHIVKEIGEPIAGSRWGRALSQLEFEHALTRTSFEEEPPIARKFMNLANSDFMSKNYRNSVLHAAIAIEYVLVETAIYLTGGDHFLDKRNRIRKYSKQTLGSLVKLVQSQSDSWPKGLSTNLAETRNYAAHRVGIIDSKMAKRFLDDCIKIIEALVR